MPWGHAVPIRIAAAPARRARRRVRVQRFRSVERASVGPRAADAHDGRIRAACGAAHRLPSGKPGRALRARCARAGRRGRFGERPEGRMRGTRRARAPSSAAPAVLSVAAPARHWLGVVTTEHAERQARLGPPARPGPARSAAPRYSLHADLSERTLELRSGRTGRSSRMTVAIGRPGSATPTGRFAVTDKLARRRTTGPTTAAASWPSPATSRTSPPAGQGGNRLAIHGTNAPGTIGTPASAGCLRASDADLRSADAPRAARHAGVHHELSF